MQPTNITADSAPQIAAITFALHCMSSRCIFLFKHIAGCAIGWAQPCTEKHIVGHQEGVDLISTSWHLTSPSQQYMSPCVSCLFCAKTAQRYPKAQIITLPMIGTLPEESGAPSQEKSEYILSPGQRKNESAASAHQPQGLAEPSSIEEYRGYSTNLQISAQCGGLYEFRQLEHQTGNAAVTTHATETCFLESFWQKFVIKPECVILKFLSHRCQEASLLKLLLRMGGPLARITTDRRSTSNKSAVYFFPL